MAKKTSLNKGLEALLGETTPQPTKTSKSKNKPNQESNEILISTIVANQFQPRTEFDEKALLQLSESINCLLYTSPSPRDRTRSRMPSSA